MAVRINNPTARIWSKAELILTKQEATENGYTARTHEDMTEIIDPTNGECILRAINNGQHELVRFNTEYFE